MRRPEEALASEELPSPLSCKTKKEPEDAFFFFLSYQTTLAAQLMANNPQNKIITRWERRRSVGEATAGPSRRPQRGTRTNAKTWSEQQLIFNWESSCCGAIWGRFMALIA